MQAVTLIRGDGIGLEVSAAMQKVVDASGAKIEWHVVDAGFAVYEATGEALPEEVLESIRRDKVAIKGPITTPVGTGFRSINVAMRKEFDLYTNLRPAVTQKGVKSRYEGVDIVTVRENTEDLYAGIEHMIGDDAAESIKLITRRGTERIARFAFEYAVKHGRKKITCVHKANIMKCTDGLFLRVCREVASEYPEIEFEDRIVDALCMQLVQFPERFDMLLMPNLYGDIVSDLCAGLVGGLGLAPSANIGKDCAIFEAVHGSAPDIAGMNLANPSALILSAIMMLRHIGEFEAADKIETAILKLLEDGEKVTGDLGGSLGTVEFTAAIIEMMGV